MSFVASPRSGGEVGNQLEQPLCLDSVGTQTLRAGNRLGHVRGRVVAPASDLVPEEPRATKQRQADGALANDTPTNIR
jgi:hypothetical protein